MTTELIKKEDFEIKQYTPFLANLMEFQKHYSSMVYDFENEPESLADAKKDTREISKVIKSLDQIHDDLKAPLKIKVDLIDGERKKIKDLLVEVQDTIKKQVKAHEAKEEAEMQALEDKVQAILDLAIFAGAHDPKEVRRRIKLLKGLDVTEDNYKHRRGDALTAREDVLEVLAKTLDLAIEQEKRDKELDELRAKEEQRLKKDREDRIAANAKHEAELKAKAEIEESKRKVKEAEDNAKAEADKAVQDERDRVAKEKADADAKLKDEQEAEQKRINDDNHRKTIRAEIERDIIKSFGGNGPNMSLDDISIMLNDIESGSIRHLTINY